MFCESNTSQGENNMISTVVDNLNKIKKIKSSTFKHNMLGKLVDNSQSDNFVWRRWQWQLFLDLQRIVQERYTYINQDFKV
jgi:hypothetical protein